MEKNMQNVRPRSLTDSELQRYIGVIEELTPEWQKEINARLCTEAPRDSHEADQNPLAGVGVQFALIFGAQ